MVKETKSNQIRAIFLAIALLTFCTGQIVHADDTELKGNVEETDVAPSRGIIEKKIEPMPAPVMAAPKLAPQKATIDQNKLQGGLKDSALQGAVDANQHSSLKSEAAKSQRPSSDILQGTASKAATGQGEDPDAGDQQLIVEWDKWRNRFLWAVQSGVNDSLNNIDPSNLRWDARKGTMVSKIPLGAVTWFSCQITPDRQIVHLKLEHSSGYVGYDKAVMEAVSALSGSAILRYPTRSRRKIITQEAGIQTSQSGERKFFKFNDVERRIIPGDQ